MKEKKESSKNKGGRPTKYKGAETCKHAKKLCSLGATDKDLTEFFEIAESTLNEWKLKYPEFTESLKAGKAEPDAEVEASLLMKAKGFYWREYEKYDSISGRIVTLKEQIVPDATSCIFWLKNRKPKEWRANPDEGKGEGDKQEINNLTINFSQVPEKPTDHK